jgi:hypothetical protein
MLQNYRITRRQFAGIGAATLAVATVRATTPLLSEHPPTPYRAIYDERFEAGRRFAAEAVSRSWETRAIRGDVTHVWFRDLAVRWQRGPAPIVGLTTPESLFVLERLAWDVGMRVTACETDTATHLVRWMISLPKTGDSQL